MSIAAYQEPHRLPAGVLALAVHCMFIALLYFGLHWNQQIASQSTMKVDLWATLPEETVVPPQAPKVDEAVQPPAPPPPPPQPIQQDKAPAPDIAIPDKKKVEVKAEKPKPAKKPTETARKEQEAAREKARIARQKAAVEARKTRMQEMVAQQQAERVSQEEQAAARGRFVDEYKAKIMDKIKRNIVQPPDVPLDVRAEFLVTLLPGGSVLKADLKKSSGFDAYDNAVERAILKSTPLPLPPDPQLFSAFREILMTFKPDHGE